VQTSEPAVEIKQEFIPDTRIPVPKTLQSQVCYHLFKRCLQFCFRIS